MAMGALVMDEVTEGRTEGRTEVERERGRVVRIRRDMVIVFVDVGVLFDMVYGSEC